MPFDGISEHKLDEKYAKDVIIAFSADDCLTKVGAAPPLVTLPVAGTDGG